MRKLDDGAAVYNLEVADVPEYYANGILVHNCKWRYVQETWDNLQFGLRLGANPQQMITTTPRPIKALKDIMAIPGVVVTRGSTADNSANLAAPFIKRVEERYAGTRLGRQELSGEVLDDSPDSLWRRAKIDEHRVKAGHPLPDMKRIVVAIDPASEGGGSGEQGSGAETGIIVAGIGTDGRGYVLEDCTCAEGPNGWAKRAFAAYEYHDADLIIAEKNQGGAMVEAVIRSVAPKVKVLSVHASRGKVTRAEPISALYEQGRISHCGAFAALEDQMVVFTPFGIEGGTTGDRVDALVWALTHLFPNIIYAKEPAKGETKRPDRWRSAFKRAGNIDGDWKTE